MPAVAAELFIPNTLIRAIRTQGVFIPLVRLFAKWTKLIRHLIELTASTVFFSWLMFVNFTYYAQVLFKLLLIFSGPLALAAQLESNLSLISNSLTLPAYFTHLLVLDLLRPRGRLKCISGIISLRWSLRNCILIFSGGVAYQKFAELLVLSVIL